MNDAIDPVRGVAPGHRIEPGAAPPRGEPPARLSIRGEITSIRRHSGHHESGHLIDESVGAVEFDEVVVRVEEGEVGGLIGKRVVLHVEE